jgi:hypothetical protein
VKRAEMSLVRSFLLPAMEKLEGGFVNSDAESTFREPSSSLVIMRFAYARRLPTHQGGKGVGA